MLGLKLIHVVKGATGGKSHIPAYETRYAVIAENLTKNTMFRYIVHYKKLQNKNEFKSIFLWRESPSYSNFCCSLCLFIDSIGVEKNNIIDYEQASFLHWFAPFHVGINSDVIWKRNTRPLYNVYFNVTHTYSRHNDMKTISPLLAICNGNFPTDHQGIPLTKASDAELWCFLWCVPEQTIERLVIWDAIAATMTSL